jgi:soluble lytic murein transglycosylase-like protein
MKLLIICAVLLPSALQAFCFEDAGKRYEIDHSLLETIAFVESNMNPRAVHRNSNGSFDVGLMQVNSAWIETLGLDKDKLISDACYNVMAGAKILKGCVDQHGLNWVAVGCYNATDVQKRINYSWEVFHKLKTRGQKQMAEPERRESIPSSLSFTARDMAQEGREE